MSFRVKGPEFFEPQIFLVRLRNNLDELQIARLVADFRRGRGQAAGEAKSKANPNNGDNRAVFLFIRFPLID